MIHKKTISAFWLRSIVATEYSADSANRQAIEFSHFGYSNRLEGSMKVACALMTSLYGTIIT